MILLAALSVITVLKSTSCTSVMACGLFTATSNRPTDPETDLILHGGVAGLTIGQHRGFDVVLCRVRVATDGDVGAFHVAFHASAISRHNCQHCTKEG